MWFNKHTLQTEEVRCLDCSHCNESQKKCFPESKDCENEYDLTDDDIYNYHKNDCDFYKKI